MKKMSAAIRIFGAIIFLLYFVLASEAKALSFNWFYGTGDIATGTFQTDASGNVISGTGLFETAALGTFSATIAPGSGSDTNFIYSNQFPIDVGGLLFQNSPYTLETNIFANSGTAGLGVTDNVSMYIAAPGTQAYTVADVGKLVITTATTATTVPEPATIALMGLGLAGMSRIRRRQIQA